jgi:hypothetical protein
LLESDLRKIPGVKYTRKNTKLEIIQGIISLGDARLAQYLLQTTTTSLPSSDSLQFIHREKESSEHLPWDFIDYPVSKRKLWQSWQNVIELTKFEKVVK